MAAATPPRISPAVGATFYKYQPQQTPQVTNMKSTTRQRGVGLIEALVAGLVFAVGIAAVIQLQGKFFKNSSSANARSIAMSIAQEKLEDLRAFQKVNSGSSTIVDFTDIGTNTGGRLTNPLNATGFSGGNPQKTLSVGNISFSRNWTVTDYYYNNGTLTTPVPSGTIPDQKRVVLTVTWADVGDTADQSLVLEGLINSNGAAATAALAKNSGGSGEKPKVYYTASTDTNVVSVGVGSTTKRETLVPTESGNQVKFTAYTYTATGQLLRQEDFLTVSCNCAFTTSGQARTASYAKWDGNSYKDQEGDLVNKDKGCVTNGNNSNCVNNAEELCSTCCSDHHDPGTSAVDASNNKYCNPTNSTDDVRDRCFDPFRAASDFTGGKHKHYTSDGVEASSGQYLESCRMKRINGYWRVYQDWHRVEVSAFPLSELAIVSNQTSSTETNYANYVKDIVDAILNDNTITKFYGQTFTLPTTKPDATNRTTSNPLTVAVGDQVELTSRAVYIDYLSNDVLTKIREQKSANADYLIHVPFYEIDVTDRAPNCNDATNVGYGGWCSPDVNKVLVGAGDVTDHNGNGLASGTIKGVAATSTPVNIKYSIRRSNSGLMGLSEPVDRASPTVANSDILRDELSTSTTSPRDIALVAVSVTSGTGPTTHQLTVSLIGGTPSTGTLQITPDSGTATCSGSGTSYTCPSVPNNTGGQLQFTGNTSTGESCTGSGSYAATASNQSVTLTIACQPVSSTHILTITLSPPANTTLFGVGTFTSDQATGCSGSAAGYTCTESDTATGNANWTYSGRTNLGGICSGSGTYATGTAAHSITLPVTCVTTRQLTVCLKQDNFDTGTLYATPTGGTQTTCDAPKADSASCGNNNKSSICTVPIGIAGSLSFSGVRTTGSKTCTASGTYSTADTPPSLLVKCQ